MAILTIAATSLAHPKLTVVEGGYMGMGEIRVGAGGSTGAGATAPTGYMVQTGGTVNLNSNLIVGRFGSSGSNPNNGVGYYTISDGNITYTAGATGNMIIGGGNATGASQGTFTVIGDDAYIAPKNLYVGSDGVTNGGTGHLVYELTGSSPGAVSPIEVTDTSIGANGSTATLYVTRSSGTKPQGAIVLVKNSSVNPVTGAFTSVTIGSSLAGYSVVYNYNADGTANDIALVPEPATIALFGLGLLALVRRPHRK